VSPSAQAVRVDRGSIAVWIVPCLEDNYAFLFARDGHAWAVDPGDSRPVLAVLRDHGLALDGILITHHHADHTAGIPGLIRVHSVPVWAPEDRRSAGGNRILAPETAIQVLGLTLHTLATPGHAVPHLALWLPEPRILFSGDLLFAAGCGRVREGTYLEMFASLERLRDMPGDTLVFPGHNYTRANLEFATSLDPGDAEVTRRLRWAAQRDRAGEPTIPSLLSTERATNPFLRVRDPAFLAACRLGGKEPAQAFEALRRRKDQFG